MCNRIFELFQFRLDIHQFKLELTIPALQPLVIRSFRGCTIVEGARFECINLNAHIFILFHQVVHALELGLETLVLSIDLIVLSDSQLLLKLILFGFQLHHLVLKLAKVFLMSTLLNIVSIDLLESNTLLLSRWILQYRLQLGLKYNFWLVR